MKFMSEVIYLKNTFFHMFKYVEVVKCIEKTYLSHLVVSDFLQLHGLKPTRVLCPWNSPGKNTGVGSHSLLQRIFPDPGTEARSPALQVDSLLSDPPGKPY